MSMKSTSGRLLIAPASSSIALPSTSNAGARTSDQGPVQISHPSLRLVDRQPSLWHSHSPSRSVPSTAPPDVPPHLGQTNVLRMPIAVAIAALRLSDVGSGTGHRPFGGRGGE